MTHSVVFAPEARADLFGLYDYIAARGGAERALAYVERIEGYCRGFATFPERGTRRDDIRPGLRLVGFARRVSIAFYVTASTVTIIRILYAGRDLTKAFDQS